MHDDCVKLPDENAERGAVSFAVEVADTFNYAAWQNAVPLLRRMKIENSSEHSCSALKVVLESSPAFLQRKQWVIDRVPAGDSFSLDDIDLDIDPAYLDGLDEAVRGVLTFTLSDEERVLQQTKLTVRVLARDEWGGIPTMAELLPAFVTPNDPAISTLLKSASDLLGRSKHATALDGYQSADPDRAFLLTAALWSAVCERNLTYANPPGSFEKFGQKTRRVGAVLSEGLATCLDSTLLFCSGLEAIGLNSSLVMIAGHCFAGVWVVNKTFKRLVETDCSEIRKAIAAQELIVFETTLVTQHPAVPFTDAMTVAQNAISEENERNFVAVIDVARARMAQIRPLASHRQRPATEVEATAAEAPALPDSPGYERRFVPAEPLPTTPAGRIERWQRKLLDLSLRNRLLNFRPTLQTVPIICPNVSALEDRLASGARLRLVSLPEGNPLGLRDAELHRKRTQTDLNREFTKQAFQRDEIVSPVSSQELDARLIALFRKVKNDLAEGGSNTLYLAVGFLRWKQHPADERTFRAPLLLAPVKLIRQSASSPFYLANHDEDEVRFNATLLQLLKKDFACDMTAFDSSLPMDDCGVDVPQVLDRMREAVRDIPGFEVVEEVAIASFSFAKYLMWKDLVERVGELEKNRVVRHLIRDPDKAFATEGASSMPQAHEIDTRYRPADIFHPLPADSSQLAAVMAASEGHDLVIVGPPGTGKSQTIANLIAQCLATGKTVLFVAEKTAALDVVQRRLLEQGLGDCCVELHSNKAEKRRFLDQLKASWTNRRADDNLVWEGVSEQLRQKRDQLNEYVAAVHMVDSNGWTAYGAMGEWIRDRGVTPPRLPWPATTRHDRAAYDALQSLVAELASTFTVIGTGTAVPRLQASEWSASWESELLECCRQLATAAESFASALAEFAQFFGLPNLRDIALGQLQPLYRLTQKLLVSELPPLELLRHVNLDGLQAALKNRRLLREHESTTKQSLENSLQAFCGLMGANLAATIRQYGWRTFYQCANVLAREAATTAELVFHPSFDALEKRLAERPQLLQAREDAASALRARTYSPALMDRIPSETLEEEWRKAGKAIWPLRIWKLKATQKKLAAYMTPGRNGEPDIDFPLLREYHASGLRLAENLASLALPSSLESAVAASPQAITAEMQSAARVRAAFSTIGLSPSAVGNACRQRLDALAAAARKLFQPAREAEAIRAQLKENAASLGLSGALQAKVDTESAVISAWIEAVREIRQILDQLALTAESRAVIYQAVTSAPAQRRQQVASACRLAAKRFQEAWLSYTQRAASTPVSSSSQSAIRDAAAQAQTILSRRTALRPWTAWNSVRQRAEKEGLVEFVHALETKEIRPSELAARFRLAYAHWWLPKTVDRREPLRRFQRFRHEAAVDAFRSLDEQARAAASPRIRAAIVHHLPPTDQVPRQSELGLLRHQMGLQRPSKSIREMITAMPETFRQLAPCLLMSPLSIAQYLPANQPPFDVVVFDEASQIPTWDAIGAIARGKQTIIVGDPKQLPPTNFFGKADNDEENDELEDHEKDLESILDEVQAAGLPTRQLNWHYRSRHESLIAFSNWNYYGNRLVTFPAAESADRGVSFNYVRGAVYDRGNSRTNRKEAEAIVSDLVAKMQRCLAKPENERLTYAVVTFNSQQQTLIQDLLDAARRDRPELEWFFTDERFEPTVVKNLENVQGDERDVILFSITFGFDVAGAFRLDFGALNRVGGERRLNVAVTRAKQQLAVYSSFLPDHVRTQNTAARGVHDLKAFLEYAMKGATAMAARADGSVGGFESPLEEAVAAALEQRGWRVDPQVGVSSFRIDLGIVHPDKPGAYLAGIECDGATYHRSPVARDRDKIRQQILENLGWSIVRVWSTDWWYDPDSAIRETDERLTELLRRDRERAEIQVARSAVPRSEANSEPLAAKAAELRNVPGGLVDSQTTHSERLSEPDSMESQPTLIAGQVQAVNRPFYSRIDLGDVASHQDRFFEAEYTDCLRAMANSVLVAQSPIRDDVLAREVARAHGFLRMNQRIKSRVLELLSSVPCTQEPVGTFFWAEPGPQDWVPFRYPGIGQERRKLDEIALPELIGLVREHPNLVSGEQGALSLAREIGLARLASSARDRLEAAIEAAGHRDRAS